jgi:hypothetical protein
MMPGLNLEHEAEKFTSLNEFDVRKPLVISISRRREEQRLYSLVYNLTFSNYGLKSGIFKCISLLNVSGFWVITRESRPI